MSRKKVEGRSPDGSPIEILRMEAAVVSGHRLAFNLRGFPPIEPGMGSLEPCGGDRETSESESEPLLAYERPECHGALIKLTPENYERVMKSEGITGQSNQGYEEVVITAVPYDSPQHPVKAIALRAREHVRLAKDPCPSQRYMNILREGAKELNLKTCYQEFLANHPVQQNPKWLKQLAIYNFVVTGILSFKYKIRFLSKIQSWFLFKIYVPSNGTVVSKALCEIGTAIILLPVAFLGFFLYRLLKVTNSVPPMMARFISMLDDESAKSSG